MHVFNLLFRQQGQYNGSNMRNRQGKMQPQHKQQPPIQKSAAPVDTVGMQQQQVKHQRGEIVHPAERDPVTMSGAPQPRDQRDSWYRDDWISRQDNSWQHDAHQRDSYAYRQERNRMRSPSPQRRWEVEMGGGGGYYRLEQQCD